MALPRDMYSILFMADARTTPFYFALFVFVFQISILTLIMLDIIDLQNPWGNALAVPAGAIPSVRATQVLAILVLAVTQDDVLTFINVLHHGYHPPAAATAAAALRSPQAQARSGCRGGEGGSKWQWALAEGVLSLVATFIIVMQLTEVVGLFVDFLAMTFVSDIDDIVFALCRDGFFGVMVRRSSSAVERVRVPKSSTLFHRYFRPVVFFVITSALITGWVIIVTKQNSGDYLTCRSIFIQFSDDFLTDISWFSGLFDVQPLMKLAGRVDYVARPNPYAERDELYGTAMFSFCDTENSWTFSFADPDKAFNPCDWYAKNVPTNSHNIMAVANDQWYVLDPESSEPVPFQHFVLRCNNCSKDAAGRSCSEYCQCLNNKCECVELSFGMRCEFNVPCGRIKLDETHMSLPSDWGRCTTH